MGQLMVVVFTRTSRWIMVGFAGIAALVGTWFIVANALYPPYYRVHSYTILPTTACPGDEVQTGVDREIKDFPFLERGEFTLDPTSWINLDTGGHIVLPPVPGDLKDRAPGRMTVTSPFLRTAPSKPGRWRLETTMTLDGRVLLWPRYWQISFATKDFLTVSEPDSQECSQ